MVAILLIILFPRTRYLNDGGTVEYTAILYKVSKIHRLNANSLTGYEDGITIEILGLKIYENVDKHMDYLH